MYKIKQFHIVNSRLLEKKSLIQVLWGPRQVGKTTLIEQVLKEFPYSYFVSADEPTLKDSLWLKAQWQQARLLFQKTKSEIIFVIDEVQKIENWSETVKLLWDEDKRKNIPLKVVLLGSSSLLIQKGLTESLTGRFELIPIMHWDYDQMHKAFNWDLNTYLFFGGYPGAAPLIQDEPRWRRYILDSIIETTLSRDILLLTRIDKPALMRRLFLLACHYSGQILSYQKMLGQLQDAGNTTTLAHYLTLLSQACLMGGIENYSGIEVRKRASSPKLQVFNSALFSVCQNLSFSEATKRPEFWGRVFENAVGQYLYNQIQGTEIELYYFREKNSEVDFVLKKYGDLVGIEVKSGSSKLVTSGMKIFQKKYPHAKVLLVGEEGISLKEFLTMPINDFFHP